MNYIIKTQIDNNKQKSTIFTNISHSTQVKKKTTLQHLMGSSRPFFSRALALYEYFSYLCRLFTHIRVGTSPKQGFNKQKKT